MSSVKIQGSATGTVVFTIAIPEGTSTDRTINLADEAGTFVTKDASNNISGVATINGQALGSKPLQNIIDNGDMTIDQRSSGAATTDNTSFNTVDRWKTYQITATSNTQAVSDVPTGYGFTKSLKTTVTATGTVGTSGLYGIWQVIEGYNLSVLEYGTASARTSTISFWVKGSVTGTYGASIQRSNALDRQYGFTYTINSANTWEYKTVTIPGDTGGTWPADNNAGATLMFMLGAGTSRLISTTEQWQAVSLALQPTGTVDLTGTLNATFQITGVQWEVGSSASDFIFEDRGTKLRKCQRYYYRIGSDLHFSNRTTSTGISDPPSMHPMSHPTTMRSTPSLTIASTASVGGTGWRSRIDETQWAYGRYQGGGTTADTTVVLTAPIEFDAEL